MLKKYEGESAKLFTLIKKVKAGCAPRLYIINRKTGTVHKALTLLNDRMQSYIAVSSTPKHPYRSRPRCPQ